MSLDFDTMTTVNAERCQHWHGPNWRMDSDPWTKADWSNAMCGEAGELANIIKKIRRLDCAEQFEGKGVPVPKYDKLMAKARKEAGDVVLYLDLLMTKMGINLGDCVRESFNEKSIEQGFVERL